MSLEGGFMQSTIHTSVRALVLAQSHLSQRRESRQVTPFTDWQECTDTYEK